MVRAFQSTSSTRRPGTSPELRDAPVENVEACTHHVLQVAASTGSAGEIVEPKGLHEKPVPLAPMLRAILAEAIAGKRPTDPVVTTRRGTAASEGGLDGALRRIQGRLGIERVWSLHKLRHFFATKLLRNGVNIETVRELLRHRELSSTARYAHSTARDMAEAVASLLGS